MKSEKCSWIRLICPVSLGALDHAHLKSLSGLLKKHIRRVALSIILSLSLLQITSSSALSQPDQSNRIGKIRAALVFYIVKFVEFKTPPTGPIRICVIGDDPLKYQIADTVHGKLANGAPLTVAEFSSDTDLSKLKGCHLSFFGEDAVKRSTKTIEAANSAGMLTVCAASELTWNSCLIQIFEENNKPRIGVDLKNRAAQGFLISSELLSVAVVNKSEH